MSTVEDETFGVDSSQSVQFSRSVMSHLLVTAWTVPRQASLSITNSQNLLKLMAIESVISSNHLILCCSFFSRPQSFPASGSFPMSQLFTSSGQSIGSSASASVYTKNIQGWFPLGLTGLISLLSKGLSTVSSSTIVQKHQFFGIQHSLWSNSHIHTWLLKKNIALTILTILWLYFVGKLIEREALMDIWQWKKGVWWIHLLEQGIMSTWVQMLSNTCGEWHADWAVN